MDNPLPASPAVQPAAGMIVHRSALTSATLVAAETRSQGRGDEIAMVPIRELAREGSPRSTGIDLEHVRNLVESATPLPPIVVHRSTMQIVDGFHRVAAALHQGLDVVKVQFVDGPADLVFAMAVRANVAHGLPLSLADRRVAASRIVRTHIDWSDRAIAEITGLSPKTVQRIRCEEGDTEDASRRGRDGRLRPLNAAAGRALAAELIAARPEASLREIAAEAGISPNTVRDVRARLRKSDEPTAEDPRRGRRERRQSTSGSEMAMDVTSVLDTLARDPSLRMNAGGRELLRWVHLHAVGPETADVFHPAPAHCIEHLIELARRCSANWAKLASELEQAHRVKTAV